MDSLVGFIVGIERTKCSSFTLRQWWFQWWFKTHRYFVVHQARMMLAWHMRVEITGSTGYSTPGNKTLTRHTANGRSVVDMLRQAYLRVGLDALSIDRYLERVPTDFALQSLVTRVCGAYERTCMHACWCQNNRNHFTLSFVISRGVNAEITSLNTTSINLLDDKPPNIQQITEGSSSPCCMDAHNNPCNIVPHRSSQRVFNERR